MRHLNIAPCNCRTSQGATRQLRTLRLTHVAPCDIATSHLATSRYRTLRLSLVAPCDSKTPFSTPKSRPTTAVPCLFYNERARGKSRSHPSTRPTSPAHWRKSDSRSPIFRRNHAFPLLNAQSAVLQGLRGVCPFKFFYCRFYNKHAEMLIGGGIAISDCAASAYLKSPCSLSHKTIKQ